MECPVGKEKTMNRAITHCPACNGWIRLHSPECPHCHTHFSAADTRRIANPMREYVFRVYLLMAASSLVGGLAYGLLNGSIKLP